MLHKVELLANFDFYVCLRVKFHKSLFWVLILAAGGPYWVSISQKMGPYLKAWGSLIVLGTVNEYEEAQRAKRRPEGPREARRASH